MGGCAAFDSARSTAASEEQRFVRVFPVAEQEELWLGLERPDNSTAQAIVDRCFPPENRHIAPIPALLLSALAGSGVRLGLNALENRLKRELKEYSSSYMASYGGVYPDSKTVCWRVTRGRLLSSKTGAREEIDFDTTVAFDRTVNAFEGHPVRLFFGRPSPAKTSANTTYGIALRLVLKAATPKGVVQTIDSVVLKDNVEFSGAPVTKYYGDPREAPLCGGQDLLPLYCGKNQRFQLINSVEPLSVIEVTATVSEVGASSRLLKFLSKLFAGAKEKIGDGLTEIAADKVQSEDSD